MYGFRAQPRRIGLRITTATGTISSLGDTPGWMTSRGDLPHSITGAGLTMRVRGAGCQPRPELRGQSTCVLFTRPRWSPGSVARISPSALASAEETTEETTG